MRGVGGVDGKGCYVDRVGVLVRYWMDCCWVSVF